MDHAAFRAQFPVLEVQTYLNAGSCGPLPARALAAAADSGLAAAQRGRGLEYFERTGRSTAALRAAYAGVLGGHPEDVAITTATSDGMARVLQGLRLGRGDVVLTADDEHPGLLGPLAAAQRVLGVTVRVVPPAELPGAVDADVRLVACSHVSWITGALAPVAELVAACDGRDVPLLLDGAQGAGAVRVDVETLGCAFYAGAGQKWLCGPVGTGMLWAAPRWRERLEVLSPTFVNLGAPVDGLRAEPWPDARALDAPALSAETTAAALAAHEALAEFGWDAVWQRSASLAAQLAEGLQATGREVAPRGATTLVSWRDADAAGTAARLAAEGIALRSLPGTEWVRASVGAWNDEGDLERLLSAT